MDRALFLSMTGAKHNMRAQTVHANNLANVGTNGFKADLAQARSMGVYYGDGYPTRAFSLAETPAIDFRQGTAMRTDRDFDIALENDGFIAVQAPDGSEAYTRNGNMYVDSIGILRTGNGLPVIGEGGPIAIPNFEKADIAVDGTLTVVVLGEKPDVLATVDRIKMVNPDPSQLVKSEDGLIRLKDGSVAPVDAGVRLVPGFLEASNVNVVGEFTEFLSLARQYEMNIKLMHTVDENAQASARLLQIS